MTKYVVRKLDFGYLTRIKKKILYLNYFNRIIRFKNRSGLYFKKNFKIFINRVSLYPNLKYLYKSHFTNIVKLYQLTKIKFRFSNSIVKGFNLKLKYISFKNKHINYNFLKKNHEENFNNNIKLKVNLFLNKKKQVVRNQVRRFKRRIENIHNNRFKNKHIQLKIKKKISKKFIRNFYKYKKKATKQDLLYLKKKINIKNKFTYTQSLYNIIIANSKLTNTKVTTTSQKFVNKIKKVRKNKIDFIQAHKNIQLKKKTQRQIRKDYLIKQLLRKTKRKKNIKKLNLVRKLILKTKYLKLTKIKILQKFNIVIKFSKNIRNFRILLKKNYKYLSKLKKFKLIFRYFRRKHLKKIFKTKLNKNKLKKKNLKKYINKKKKISNKFIIKNRQYSYLNIRIRKLKIKYYICKTYIVSSKYLKNILNAYKNNIFNYININLVNINRYINFNNQLKWIKFFFNFIFFYFFKYCKIKSISKGKRVKKKLFINNINYLNLDRPLKKLKMNHIFETQNSFFFFRFIRLSKKILDLFLPIKQKYIKDNSLKILTNKNIIYYKFLNVQTKLNNFYYQFNTINEANILTLNNFFFLIFCKVLNKKENILIEYLC